MITRSELLTHIAVLLSTALMLGAISGCSNGGGGTGSPTAPVPYIPDFTFTWENRDDPSNSYFFDPGDDFEVETGTLVGDEAKDGINSPLEGTFAGRDLEFTVDRGDPDFGEVDCDDGEGECVEFSGSFLDDDTIEMSSAQDGRVVLVRVRND